MLNNIFNFKLQFFGHFRIILNERFNRITLPVLVANQMSTEEEIVYRASVSDEYISWFAGQEKFVMENPGQVHCEANLDNATRGKRPLDQHLIYPANHAILIFIKHFSEALCVREKELVVLLSSDQPKTKWYKVDKLLVDRARYMIKFIVYAQLYYTTLRDCKLVRTISSEHEDFALVMRLAADWALKVDPQTKTVSDWSSDDYRPTVTMHLRVTYYVVVAVESSAAALHQKVIKLISK